MEKTLSDREDRLSLFGWLSFDFANTIFSMNIVTMFFSLWLLDDLGCKDIYYALSYSLSMVLVALLMPLYGFYSDIHQNKKSWLIKFTLFSIVSTALLGVTAYLINGITARIIFALLFFAAANFFYEGGIAFYNALLRSVSSPENVGRTSGLGVGLGYIGGIFGLLIVFPIVKGQVPFIPAGRESAFIPTAILFFIFSIPAFFLIREKTFESIYRRRMSFTQSFNNLRENLRQAREHKGAFRFLIANFFFEDAVVTAIMFMAVYAEKVVGFSDRLKIELWVVATLAAALGSVLAGKVSDRLGPRRTTIAIMIGWITILIIISLLTFQPLFWVAACFVGIFLGSTWTVARPLLNSLVPDQKLGLFYGLYALSGKTAAIIGPLVWGLITWFLTADNQLVDAFINTLRSMGIRVSFQTADTIEYRFALIALSLLMLVGLILFRKVPDLRRHPVS